MFCFFVCGHPDRVCRHIDFVVMCSSILSHVVIFIHRRCGDVISDYPDVTSLALDVYIHIGHVQHDSTYCFHYMIMPYYDISCAFIIGT